MASIIRVAENLGGTLNITGYLPSLGVPGYGERYRASHIPGAVGDSLPAVATWANDLAGGGLAVKMTNTTVTPKLEYLAGGTTTEAVTFPFGHETGFSAGNQEVGNRTIALLVGGVAKPSGALARWIVNYNGFAIASSEVGWEVTTRSVGQTPLVRAALTGAASEANQRYVLLLSSTTGGDIRLRVKKGAEAPLTATATGAARGADVEFKLGAAVYGGAARGSHPVAHIATWGRVLTPAEEDKVIANMAAL